MGWGSREEAVRAGRHTGSSATCLSVHRPPVLYVLHSWQQTQASCMCADQHRAGQAHPGKAQDTVGSQGVALSRPDGGREGLQPQAQPQAASCKQAPTEESEARKADTGGNDKKVEERRRHNTKR